jgi:hypothetical protein
LLGACVARSHVKKIGLHVLRAATATNTLEREADIALVPESLGLGCGEHHKPCNCTIDASADPRASPTFKFSY